MFARCHLSLWFVVLLSSPLAAWRTNLPSSTGAGYVERLAVSPEGDPIAVGQRDGTMVVTRFDQQTGQLIWSRPVVPSADPTSGLANVLDLRPSDVKVDSSGTVFALGWVSDSGWRRIAASLNGANGAILWVRDLGPNRGDSLVLDGSGGVIVGGDSVVKLSQSSGVTLWETVPFGDGAWDLAVDAAGDVFAVADAQVCKLDGANGTTLWLQSVPDPYTNFEFSMPADFAIATDSDGNVLVGGGMAGDGNRKIVKYDGVSGAVVWTSIVDVTAVEIAITSSDDVVAVGSAFANPIGLMSGAVKLDGQSGSIIWSTHPFAEASPWDGGQGLLSVALDDYDHVYVAGPFKDSARFQKLRNFDGNVAWDRSVQGNSNSQVANASFSHFASTIVHEGPGRGFVGGRMVNSQSNEDSHDWFVASFDEESISAAQFYPGKLNPLWENWFLWVYEYPTLERLHEVIKGALRDNPRLAEAVWTDGVEATLEFPDRIVLLTPESEEEALLWIVENQEALAAERTAPIHLFLEEGGRGSALLLELVERGLLR